MRSVLRSHEALAAFGRPYVRRELRAGRWQQPTRGVVVTHNGPLTNDECEEVALCTCAPAAAFGGLTALARDGLRGFSNDTTFVVLPEGARRPMAEGLVCHWSELLRRDIHPNREPRRTRPERSVVDAATWAPSDRYARAITLASVQQGIVTSAGLLRAAQRRGAFRRRALVNETALDAEGGIHSLPERDFDDIRISARIPPPTRQQRVRGPGGTFYLDVDWPQFGAFVEVHGLPHHDVKQWDHDLLRGNELAIGGRTGLYFTSYSIRHEKARVRDQLTRFLRTRGWQ